MKIEKAISIIDGILATYRGTREEHITLQVAMETIKKAVDPEEKEEKDNG